MADANQRWDTWTCATKLDVAQDDVAVAPEMHATVKGAGRGKRVTGGMACKTLQRPSGGGKVPQENVKKVTVKANGEEGEKDVELPLEVNDKVKCLWKDGKYHEAKIIERRNVTDRSDVHAWQYYVHYLKMNRRMDTWMTDESFDLTTVVVESDKGEKDAKGKANKRKLEDAHVDGHGDMDPHQIAEHEEFTKVKNISRIELGKYQCDTWYFSPFPEEYNDTDILYFCEFTLQFFKRKEQLQRHLRKVEMRHPPGDEIYRHESLSMFEVDGKKEKIFCQNLCYLAKLFLDHKTLYYDVDLFLFYILCEVDERGCHIVGYFSKEKSSEEGYNLACILTLPSYQRKGYGKFLISFSYELSKKEGKIGTPERPLSDLGAVSYNSYWTRVLLNVIKDTEGTISIRELSEMTCIKTDDIISTLQKLQLIQYQRGQHVISAAPELIDQCLKSAGSEGKKVYPEKLIWTPYNAEKEYTAYRG